MKFFRKMKTWFKNIFRKTPPPPAGTYKTEKLSINKRGLDLIVHFEGFYPKAYLCPARVWTLGHGTIRYPNGTPVRRGDTCTREQALEWLKYEIDKKEISINHFLDAHKIKLNSNEFSALVSFCFNLGTGPLVQKGRSLHEAMLTRDRHEIIKAMKLYNKAAGKTLPGLVRRREWEAELFLLPVL